MKPPLLLVCVLVALFPFVSAGEETADAAAVVRPVVDDQAPGWRALGPGDFAQVNSAPDTWSWKEGLLHCTGQPVSVLRSAKEMRPLVSILRVVDDL